MLPENYMVLTQSILDPEKVDRPYENRLRRTKDLGKRVLTIVRRYLDDVRRERECGAET